MTENIVRETELIKQIKDLQFALAEMTVENEALKLRVKKLATRQPQWPKGYRPVNRPGKFSDRKQHGNWKNRTNERNPH